MKTHGTLKYRPGVRPGRGQFLLLASPQVMTRAKRLLPRAEPGQGGVLLVSDTPEAARDLQWITERYPVDAEATAAEALSRLADAHRDTEERVVRILEGERLHLDLREAACERREYQLLAAEMVLQTGRLLLVDDVGLGKSISGLLALRDPRALPAVVVCLTHLPRQWFREVAKALPWLLVHTVTTLEPYDPSRRRGVGRRPDVLIVPWSKLRGWGNAVAGEAATVIFDEAQELRTGASQKYWAAETAAAQADFIVGLTATPVYNYGGEIWNILNIIAPDVLGSYTEFTREWCGEPVNDGERADGTDSTRTASNKVRVADPAALSVYLREQGVMLRRTRKDVGRELPPIVTVPHIVDADADMLDRMNEEVVMLADAILRKETERTTRWRASGELDWKLRRATGLAKAPYVADFVRTLLETEERVVLFGWHRSVYEQWRLRLADLRPVFYTGTESPTQKARSVDAFTEGDARVLIVSLRAGAGLDGLQDACHVAVFGELDWSPGIHIQCIGRLHRDGQAEPVVAYFLYTEDGSDPVILDVLNVKRMQSEPLLDPSMEPLAQASGTEERVRRLAEQVIRRHRERKRR